MSVATQTSTNSSLINILGFLKSLFEKKKTAHENHILEVKNAWEDLRASYSQLHHALNLLEATEGDVIKFSNFAEVLNIPDIIVQNHFDTVCFTCIDERAQKNSHNALSVGIPGQFCLESKGCQLLAKKIIIDCVAANIKKLNLCHTLGAELLLWL